MLEMEEAELMLLCLNTTLHESAVQPWPEITRHVQNSEPGFFGVWPAMSTQHIIGHYFTLYAVLLARKMPYRAGDALGLRTVTDTKNARARGRRREAAHHEFDVGS